MKRVSGIVLAFALVLAIVPGIAGDTFHAFSAMPAAQLFSLVPLSDEQLAAVQGKEILTNVLMPDLLQILSSLFVIPATTVSSGMEQVNTTSTQSFSHTQQNIGGNGHQQNTVNVMQTRQ
jgi:hypothetical protein